MPISMTDPLEQAFRRTRWILFQPFDLAKWFILGFCAWLAYLGEGVTGFNFNAPGNFQNGGPGGPNIRDEVIEPVLAWIRANLTWLIPVAVGAVLVLVAIGMVLVWLQSRGKFMLLEGVARNQAEVVAPWHRFRFLGNSLFWFRFIVGLSGMAGMATILVLGVALAWSDIQAWTFGQYALPALIGGGLLLGGLGLVMMVIGWLTEDFIIPAMYIRGARSLEACRIVWNEILKVHPGPVALFGLVRIVVAIGLNIAALIYLVLATCVTCGVACCLYYVPYVGMVMLLPLPVFVRSFTLYFVQQFGPEWQAISAEPPDARWATEPMLEADGG